MQQTPVSSDASSLSGALAILDFGALQARYQALPVVARAQAALDDATPALQMAESILEALAAHPRKAHLFDDLRRNAALTGKMRASEAKTALMDTKSDFIEATLHKLAAWRKTMERLSRGEGVAKEGKDEYIPGDAPVAAAVAAMASASGYLSIVQLALAELAKKENKTQHQASIARIRRAATLLSDCETASGISGLVH